MALEVGDKPPGKPASGRQGWGHMRGVFDWSIITRRVKEVREDYDMSFTEFKRGYKRRRDEILSDD